MQIAKIFQLDSAPIKNAAGKMAQLFLDIGEKFWRDNLMTFASSLAYTTLLALAPIMAVSLSLVTSFDVSRQKIIGFVFNKLLPNQQIATVIEKNMEVFSANAASVSIFGVILLALTGIWVMGTVESAFNMIWKVEKHRSLFNQFVSYWSTLTFTPVLIAASIVLSSRIQKLVSSGVWLEYSYVHGLFVQASPYFMTWVAFFLLYKLIPNTRVKFAPAWIGAMASGTMFEFAKLAFDYYIRLWSTYTAIYGALAALPIFLMWLYITWLIVLLGAVITYTIQYPGELHTTAKEGFDRAKFHHYYALRILLETVRSFENGNGAPDPAYIQTRLGITVEFFGDIARRLQKLGLIAFLEGSDERFLLTAPPEKILIADIIAHIDGDLLSVAPEPVDTDRESLASVLGEIRSDLERGAGGLTLLDLAKRMDGEENR